MFSKVIAFCIIAVLSKAGGHVQQPPKRYATSYASVSAEIYEDNKHAEQVQDISADGADKSIKSLNHHAYQEQQPESEEQYYRDSNANVNIKEYLDREKHSYPQLEHLMLIEEQRYTDQPRQEAEGIKNKEPKRHEETSQRHHHYDHQKPKTTKYIENYRHENYQQDDEYGYKVDHTFGQKQRPIYGAKYFEHQHAGFVDPHQQWYKKPQKEEESSHYRQQSEQVKLPKQEDSRHQENQRGHLTQEVRPEGQDSNENKYQNNKHHHHSLENIEHNKYNEEVLIPLKYLKYKPSSYNHEIQEDTSSQQNKSHEDENRNHHTHSTPKKENIHHEHQHKEDVNNNVHNIQSGNQNNKDEEHQHYQHHQQENDNNYHHDQHYKQHHEQHQVLHDDQHQDQYHEQHNGHHHDQYHDKHNDQHRGHHHDQYNKHHHDQHHNKHHDKHQDQYHNKHHDQHHDKHYDQHYNQHHDQHDDHHHDQHHNQHHDQHHNQHHDQHHNQHHDQHDDHHHGKHHGQHHDIHLDQHQNQLRGQNHDQHRDHYHDHHHDHHHHDHHHQHQSEHKKTTENNEPAKYDEDTRQGNKENTEQPVVYALFFRQPDIFNHEKIKNSLEQETEQKQQTPKTNYHEQEGILNLPVSEHINIGEKEKIHLEVNPKYLENYGFELNLPELIKPQENVQTQPLNYELNKKEEEFKGLPAEPEIYPLIKDEFKLKDAAIPSEYHTKEKQRVPSNIFKFKYGVDDPETGDMKSHYESRDGGVVEGEYKFTESDGKIRTVKYRADKEHGFNAIVLREDAPSSNNNS